MSSVTKKISEMVMNQLEQQFLKGQLEVGDRLPAERELATRYQVSRNTVRQALQALEMKGMLEIRHGGGSYVRQSAKDAVHDQLSEHIVRSNERLALEMLEVRRALEVEAASLAAQRATTAHVKMIQEALEEMAVSMQDVEKGIQADVRFHLEIVRASQNPLLIQLVQTLSERLEETIRVTRKQRFSSSDRYKSTYEEHRAIFVAIASGNPEEAKALMEKHITQIRGELIETSIQNG